MAIIVNSKIVKSSILFWRRSLRNISGQISGKGYYFFNRNFHFLSSLIASYLHYLKRYLPFSWPLLASSDYLINLSIAAVVQSANAYRRRLCTSRRRKTTIAIAINGNVAMNKPRKSQLFLDSVLPVTRSHDEVISDKLKPGKFVITATGMIKALALVSTEHRMFVDFVL